MDEHTSQSPAFRGRDRERSLFRDDDLDIIMDQCRQRPRQMQPPPTDRSRSPAQRGHDQGPPRLHRRMSDDDDDDEAAESDDGHAVRPRNTPPEDRDPDQWTPGELVPLQSSHSRRRHAGSGRDATAPPPLIADGGPTTAAERTREYLTSQLHFDPGVARHAWRPGGRDLLRRTTGLHGPACALCLYIPDCAQQSRAGDAMLEHARAINNMLSAWSDPEVAGAMVAAYWASNVEPLLRDEHRPCAELPANEAIDHVRRFRNDARADALQLLQVGRDTLRTIEQHMIRRNDVTGEEQLDTRMVNAYVKVADVFTRIHHANWDEARFRVPSDMSRDAVNSAAPLVRIFNPAPGDADDDERPSGPEIAAVQQQSAPIVSPPIVTTCNPASPTPLSSPDSFGDTREKQDLSPPL
jgi:hypothetical protein